MVQTLMMTWMDTRKSGKQKERSWGANALEITGFKLNLAAHSKIYSLNLGFCATNFHSRQPRPVDDVLNKLRRKRYVFVRTQHLKTIMSELREWTQGKMITFAIELLKLFKRRRANRFNPFLRKAIQVPLVSLGLGWVRGLARTDMASGQSHWLS